MARFNPEVPKSNDPSYIGYSKELDRPRANTGVGEALAGFGKTLGAAVGAVDEGIKMKVKDSVYDGVDPIRNAQGVSDALDNQPNPLRFDLGQLDGRESVGGGAGGQRDSNAPTTTQPPEVAKYNKSIQTLTDAYAAKKIDDTMYYTQLEAMTRQIRARFPGYREEVDAAIHNVTGVTPANALRKSIIGDLQAAEAKRQAAVDADQKWLMSKGEAANRLFPGIFENPGKYDISKVKTAVYSWESVEADRTARKQELDLMEKEGNLQAADAKGYLVSKVYDHIGQLNEGAKNSISQLNQVQSEVQRALESGKPVTPEQEQAWKSQIAVLRNRITLATNDLLTNPSMGPNGKAWSMVLKDQKDRDEVMKQAMIPIDTLEMALMNKDTGLVNIVQNMNEARSARATSRLMANDQTAMLVTASKLGLGPVLGPILAQPEYKLSLTKNLMTTLGVQAAGGREANDPGNDTQTDRAIQGGAGGKNVNDVLKGKVQMLTGKDTQPEAKANLIENLYGKREGNFLDRFNGADGSRKTVYSQMTAPAVTQDILKTFGKDSPEFKKYLQWSETQAFRLFTTEINSVKGASMDSKLFSIVLDPATNRFKPELTPEGEAWYKAGIAGKNPAAATFIGQQGQPNWDKLLGANAAPLNKVNEIMGNYGEILKAGGIDPKARIQYKMGQFGFGVNGEKSPDEGGLGAMIAKGMGAVGSSVGQWLSETPANPLKGFVEKNNYQNNKRGSGTEGNGGDVSLNDSGSDGTDHPILQAIIPGESKGNYNALVFGNGSPKEANLTGMKVKDVLAYQEGMRDRGHASSAVGKYQIIQGTLQWLIDNGHINPNDTFNEATQDKAGKALLDYKAGFKDYMSGKLTYGQFLSKLENEWEAVKKFPEIRRNVFRAVDAAAKGG